MSKFKPSDVAFLRTTQEPVFVLDIKEGTSVQKFPGLSGQVATVRRPSEGREGIRHTIEFFSVEELETLDDRHKRQVEEMEEMKAHILSNDRKTNLPSDIFSTN